MKKLFFSVSGKGPVWKKLVQESMIKWNNVLITCWEILGTSVDCLIWPVGLCYKMKMQNALAAGAADERKQKNSFRG